MAKDDYFVIAYRILAYLYACLKAGETPDIDYISADSKAINISLNYWEYVMRHLYNDGYIEGVDLVPITGRKTKAVRVSDEITITPKGIEFLQENSSMSKAKEFLKTLKETIPGL
jgi:hypothetical protein